MRKMAWMLFAIALLLGSLLPVAAQNSSQPGGTFQAFWQRNGGLPVFGLALTEEHQERNLERGTLETVQYFERQRMEHHPALRGTAYEIQLGLMGVEALERQGRSWWSFSRGNPAAEHYFEQTGHAIAPQFWGYWRSQGLDLGDRGSSFRESLALFGYPISEAVMETNSSGHTVLTQWFERARFELHGDQVLLGRLGAELLMPGFRTSTPPMLNMLGEGSVRPVISSGDRLPNGYRFESIPDGIGMAVSGRGTVDLLVNHETSTVPFPPVGSPGAAADFHNAEISRLRLSQRSGEVVFGELVWTSDLNFVRFCASFMATEREGFKNPVYFTGEESSDVVSLPPNAAWPPRGETRVAGLSVAVDVRTGKRYVIPGMGRLNHENTVIVPGGWGSVVSLTTDDTFSGPSAQLYMYLAPTPEDLLEDRGQLYAFVGDDPAVNDYGDLKLGTPISGRFIAVPREVALGDQQGLENWSNQHNVFQFIRLEDLAYDKNNPRAIYMTDTGEPRAIPDPATGRLRRGPSGTLGAYPNGRVFRFVLNAADPLRVDSLDILIDADAGGYRNPLAMHNPDNIDTSANSLMIQEDPSSANPYTPRIWRMDLKTGAISVVAEADQSLDPKSRPGDWETTGIVDASQAFGPGTWFVNIMAHSIWLETEQAEGYTRKFEGGQLVLMTLPGS